MRGNGSQAASGLHLIRSIEQIQVPSDLQVSSLVTQKNDSWRHDSHSMQTPATLNFFKVNKRRTHSSPNIFSFDDTFICHYRSVIQSLSCGPVSSFYLPIICTGVISILRNLSGHVVSIIGKRKNPISSRRPIYTYLYTYLYSYQKSNQCANLLLICWALNKKISHLKHLKTHL